MDALADVRNEETQLRTAGLLPSASALATRSAPSRPAVPPLSSASSAPMPSPSARGEGGGGLRCNYCGKDDHVEAFCYRKKKAQRSQTQWQLAMAEEIAVLERTDTWDLVPTPSYVRPITCKWVYKEHGRDYNETFAPVAHMTTVRALIAVASLGVKNAFLNGELREEVYMQPLPGYFVPEGMVCRLRRSLYGLKRAPQAWFQHSASMVTAAGFSASAHDPALFVHTSSRGHTLLLLYVDDMIITGDDPQLIAFVKERLHEQFLMSDLGPLRYFLGIEVSSTHEGFYLSQEKYIQGLLDHASITDHRTDETPMELNVHLSATDSESLDDPTRYRHIVGSLVYLDVTLSLFLLLLSSTIVTFFVSYVIFVGLCHVVCSFHALALYSFKLIVMLLGLVIPLIVDLFLLIVFFLVVLLLLGRLRSRQQFLVRAQRLSCVLWFLGDLVTDFGVSVSIPTPFLTNSTGAISIALDPVKHDHTKHIGVDAYYTRAQVQDGVVTLRYVPSELQLADFFTKAQTRAQHSFSLFKLSVGLSVYIPSFTGVYISAYGLIMNTSAIHNNYNPSFMSHYKHYALLEWRAGSKIQADLPIIKAAQIPIFDGKKDVNLWLHHLEQFFQQHQTDEGKKEWITVYHVTGYAKEW
ncbi:hypothetical protein U9M48_031548 [Paspalum notatum var. saurae]|uniref:Reverse transcriptase Ty1/copia-type domain-containing protein n=1 Tax=Paspalum notatum var. saurae TaxID=547442 RepID=A0AAQ3X4H4_PASNO